MKNVTNKDKAGSNALVHACQKPKALAAAGLMAMAVGVAAGSTQASVITWQAPSTITSTSVLDTIPGDFSGATLQQSVYFGSDSATYTVATTGGQNIAFTHGASSTAAPSGTATGVFYGGVQKLSGSPTSDTSFNNVLENDSWASSASSSKPQTLQIGGLASGTSYAIQLFAYDPRSGNTLRQEEFADTVDASGNNSASFLTTNATSVIGTFTATSSVQDVYVWQTVAEPTNQWNTTVSGFTLYSVPASVPDPATLGLVAVGGLGLLTLRRRTRV